MVCMDVSEISIENVPTIMIRVASLIARLRDDKAAAAWEPKERYQPNDNDIVRLIKLLYIYRVPPRPVAVVIIYSRTLNRLVGIDAS